MEGPGGSPGEGLTSLPTWYSPSWGPLQGTQPLLVTAPWGWLRAHLPVPLPLLAGSHSGGFSGCYTDTSMSLTDVVVACLAGGQFPLQMCLQFILAQERGLLKDG